MGGVIGVAEALLHTSLLPQQRELIDILQNSSAALLDLINNVLDFSKIESGKLELEHAPVDLLACIEGAVDLVAINAVAKQIDLAYRIDPAMPPVIMGDATRLRQILMNLLNNAIKFTDTGSVQVLVYPAATPTGAAGRMAAFAVSDTGVGIPLEHQARLFQSFSQGDASTTRRYGGTGLGLVISKRLCELMGGEIAVESEVGRGSVFRFVVRAETAPGAHVALYGPQPKLAQRRVLVLGRPCASRDALVTQLHTWGLRTQVASTYDELRGPDAGGSFASIIADVLLLRGQALATLHRTALGPDGPPPLLPLMAIGQSADVIERAWGGAVRPLSHPLKWSRLLRALSGHDDQQDVPEQPTVEGPPISPAARVLLVEDDQTNRLMILHVLERLGCHADTATNGREALELLSRQRYDIALVDVQMPEVDGLEVARRVVSPSGDGRPPYLIAVTAATVQGSRERCLEAGFDEYVSKPVREQVLADALARGCARLQCGQPARADLDTALFRHIQADPRFFARVVPMYVADSCQMVADMRQALAQRERAALGGIAHKLKSGSAWVAAHRLAELCELLEACAASAPDDDLAQLFDQIADEHPRVLQSLRAATASLPHTHSSLM